LQDTDHHFMSDDDDADSAAESFLQDTDKHFMSDDDDSGRFSDSDAEFCEDLPRDRTSAVPFSSGSRRSEHAGRASNMSPTWWLGSCPCSLLWTTSHGPACVSCPACVG
jgi:hypothetical protein